MSSKPKAKGRGKTTETAMAKPKAKPKAKAKPYKMAEKLAQGTLLVDLQKNTWVAGPPKGQGGFGLIYEAASGTGSVSKNQYPYVIKIEPHENGPLFVEINFYIRNTKKDDVQKFMDKYGLESLGMPIYIASGSHECNGIRHRFLVMEKFGEDLWKKFVEGGRRFPEVTIYRLALQILNVIRYIHECGYVHADIKGSNLLIGTKKSSENKVYLVDFGLAGHYNTKEYKPDPKKMHNGTIEYTSRDAHNGVLTRRGDLEILAYNLIQWSAGKLPWEDNISDPATVQRAKETAMSDVPAFLKGTFSETPPVPIASFSKYVASMKPDDAPDYDKCLRIFEDGLKSLKASILGPLEFAANVKSVPAKRGKMKNETEGDSPEIKKSKVIKTATKKKLLDESPLPMKIPKKNMDTPKVTPNRVIMNSIATQTSLDKSREASGVRTRRAKRDEAENLDLSNVDCIENSLTETPTRSILTSKRKHTKRFEINYSSDEEVVVQTTIKKKNGDLKGWQKCPTIVNGKGSKK